MTFTHDNAARLLTDWIRQPGVFKLVIPAQLRRSRPVVEQYPRSYRAGLISPITYRGRRDLTYRLQGIAAFVAQVLRAALPLLAVLVIVGFAVESRGLTRVSSTLLIVSFLDVLLSLVFFGMKALKYGSRRSWLSNSERAEMIRATELYESHDDSDALRVFRDMAGQEDSRAAPIASANAGLVVAANGDRAGASEAFARSIAYDLSLDSERLISAPPDVLTVLTALIAQERLELNELRSSVALTSQQCQMAVETLIRWGAVRQIDRPNGRCLFELRNASPKPENIAVAKAL